MEQHGSPILAVFTKAKPNNTSGKLAVQSTQPSNNRNPTSSRHHKQQFFFSRIRRRALLRIFVLSRKREKSHTGPTPSGKKHPASTKRSQDPFSEKKKHRPNSKGNEHICKSSFTVHSILGCVQYWKGKEVTLTVRWPAAAENVQANQEPNPNSLLIETVDKSGPPLGRSYREKNKKGLGRQDVLLNRGKNELP